MRPASWRKAARHAVDRGLGRVAQPCRELSLPRTGYYHVRKMGQSNRRMNNHIMKARGQHPRYGYRRITTLLNREGRRINAKRVARVRRAEGLQVRKRQRRTRKLGPSQNQRLSATRRNEVWSRNLPRRTPVNRGVAVSDRPRHHARHATCHAWRRAPAGAAGRQRGCSARRGRLAHRRVPRRGGSR